MTGCWAIWEKRNKGVFDNGEWRGEEVVRRMREIIWEMEGAIDNGVVNRERVGVADGDRGWVRPREGWVKVNVDAGVIEGVGTGLGVVCRNASGSMEWGVTIQEARVITPVLAEALAVLQGLKEAKHAGISSVVIENDCRGVVDDLKNRRSGRSEPFLIYKDILDICTCFESVSFDFVRRNFNMVAHGLDHAMPWVAGRRSWNVDLLNWIMSLVLDDLIVRN
ncbi:uncharacterized protein LOC141631880 [Silene latifolia]|uniref:uncharacterized protein LOC141631880 n=1 Tax=Silene latifolia TaxID=37657 RepID=UPI003D76E496